MFSHQLFLPDFHSLDYHGSKWVAAVLAGRVSLPSQEEMEDTKMFYLKLEASCIPKRYTHLMAELDSQVRTVFLSITCMKTLSK
jgi:hypothetical protein